MAYEILRGSPEDYHDIIDFGNYVFHIDFPKILPKLYDNHREISKFHYIVKESNRMKALVGSFPLELKVCEEKLKVRGIGTVSVHPYSRNTGYMKRLMDMAMADIKAENYDFAVLGGQRQRYEYWGFTPCGITLNISFNSANLKHCGINIENPYQFIEFDDSLLKDLEMAVKLHDDQTIHAKREQENFIDISKSWGSRILFVYKDGEFAGYISASNNFDKIMEIVLVSPDEIDKVIVSLMKYKELNNLDVVLSFHRSKEFMLLTKFCENYTIIHSSNFYIINYINVIKAFMKLKNSLQPLEEGSLIINIEEAGRYKIEVCRENVSVQETDTPYDITLSRFDANALLFSHSGFFSSFLNSNNIVTNRLVKAWFPLPLFFPVLDNV